MKRIAILSMCLALAACKSKASETEQPPVAAKPVAATPAPAPAPAPTPAAAPKPAAPDEGSVDLADKAEHFADGDVCCLSSDAAAIDKPAFEKMNVSRCQKLMWNGGDSRYAPTKKCAAK
ncbi:MAG TPA: hypothetical protein VMJ10_05815 [Kofleriaceae bacterium]|nr:hypothetical protein [Kofleriaceae bacterium]